MQAAEDDEGTGFEGYRQAAQILYRRRDTRALSRRPPVPAFGMPAELAEQFTPHEKAKVEEPRPVDIRWAEFRGGEFFLIEPEAGRLILNDQYREHVLAGLPPHSADVPLVKALLFLLLQQDLNVSKPSDKRRRELARINRILAAAARLGEG
jgi:hypothetical protein